MANTSRSGLSVVGVLVLALGFARCSIFVSDAGTEGMPCVEDNDCADENICLYKMCVDAWLHCGEDQVCQQRLGFEAFCEHSVESCVPWSPDGYGTECEISEDCWDTGADRCIALLADLGRPRCVRTCDPGSAGDPCEGIPGGALCLAHGGLDRELVCARESWTLQTGILCDPDAQNQHCPEGTQCVLFWAQGMGICTQTECEDNNNCPTDMECHDLPATSPPPDFIRACGLPTWHGFWMNCGEGNNCTDFQGFQICTGFGFCSRDCSPDLHCPAGAVCHQDGFCVPDSPEFI